MVDVALAAGVSLQTVSRAFNPGSVIRPGTRERVMSVAAELGYRRNLAARALATNRSGLIGVIGSAIDQYGPASSIVGMARAARRAGYTLVLGTLERTGPAAVEVAIDQLVEQRVEAIVVLNESRLAAHASRRDGDPVPIVCLADIPRASHRVAVDQALGARLAAEHLIERGHRRIAVLGGPPTWLEARQRRRGWLEVLRGHGLAPVVELTGNWTAASGHRLAAEVLADDRATAMLAGNDEMALGVILAAHATGRRIPDDLAVVGFDNRPDAAYYSPPLTTVDQHFTTLGDRAIALAGSLLDGTAPQAPETITPELIIRSSS